MSMNLFLFASIEAKSKIGNHIIQEHFNLWQTPTEETRRILRSPDIKQEYILWAKQFEYVEKIDEYAPDDIFQEKEPIGFYEVNDYQDHISRLEEWLKEHDGWNIRWSEI